MYLLPSTDGTILDSVAVVVAAIFDIPTPKDDINGGRVADVYYKEKNLERIKIYCQKDTLTVAQLLLRYKGEKLIKDENIEFV